MSRCLPGGSKAMNECIVLHIEDDDASAYLFQKAVEDAGCGPRIFRVTDGEHASAFLLQTGAYESATGT